MGQVLLDTTVVVDLLRGREGAAARLRALREAGDLPHVCAVTVEETARGLRPGEEDAVGRFLSGVGIAPLSRREGWVAGTWRRQFREHGRTLAQADCLIAAAALALGGRLATGNPRHFPMTELTVEEWPAGR